MKKYLFTLLVMLGIVTATQADDTTYSYLTFETADGTATPVAIGNGLELTFADGHLSIGGQTFTLSELSKMYFSDEADITSVSVAIGELGWATYCSELPLDYTQVSGLTAYQAEFSGSSVTLSELTDGVPAGTGVLLKGEPGTYTVPVATSYSTPTANQLTGCTTAVTTSPACYVLARVNTTQVGFCLVEDGVEIPANKAYYETSSNSRAYYVINTETTGISSVTTNSSDDAWYNLQGRRVSKPTKGVYIKNGKKVMIH